MQILEGVRWSQPAAYVRAPGAGYSKIRALPVVFASKGGATGPWQTEGPAQGPLFPPRPCL